MIKHYNFNYDNWRASVDFTVDTEKFTNEHAQATLNFFLWDYDKENNPIDEIMGKYAIEVLKMASFGGLTKEGIIIEFNNKEGFCKIDGTFGITLDSFTELDIDENLLDVEITG